MYERRRLNRPCLASRYSPTNAGGRASDVAGRAIQYPPRVWVLSNCLRLAAGRLHWVFTGKQGTKNSPYGFDAANRAASIRLISGQADRYVSRSQENRAALQPYEKRRFGKQLSATVMDIERWLSQLGLDQYARTFADNDVDFAMLPRLTDADLKELGVNSLGHRKRMLFAISELATAASCATPSVVDVQADERRQVTILFADLCGFTALSQTLDPEELRELTGRYTALVDGIVLGYGGTIDKHIGDAVNGAGFGAPRAHDSDIRCARRVPRWIFTTRWLSLTRRHRVLCRLTWELPAA